MDKFIIEVSNELDSEYIQKLAFKGGYSWQCSKETRPKWLADKYLGFWPEIKAMDSHGQSVSKEFISSQTVYSFPSQASEIVKLFEKKPEFKAGDWVIRKGNYRPTQPRRIDRIINSQEYKYSDGDVNSFEYVRLATPQEVESHLISEAEKKGFVKGAKVKVCEKLKDGWYSNPRSKIEDINLVFGDAGTIESLIVKEFKVFATLDCHSAGSVSIEAIELCSYPSIKLGDYKVKFEDNHIMVGCTKVTVSQIKEIAEYYKS